MSSLIQVSESNAILYISSTIFFAQATTVRDISGTRSSSNTITVSTVNGLLWPDGSFTKTIDTPYASITFDSDAKLLHAFPFSYGGSTDSEGITVQGKLDGASAHVFDSVYISNTLSSFGYLDAQSILIGSNAVLSRPTLVDTVQSLGQTYTSSVYIPSDGLRSNYTFCNDLFSTVGGLGQLYISTASLQSTVDGLGTYGYISTLSLVSTATGLSNYILRSNLTSTIEGLGTPYISIASLVSTSTHFLGGYILGSNYTSTVAGLGTYYISAAHMTSTTQGLADIGYISTTWLTSTVDGLSGSTSGDATSLYTSTVAGLGSSKYISRDDLVSSVNGTSSCNASILQSTVAGLGTSYISVSQLTSTVRGLGYIVGSNLTSSVTGLLGTPYTDSFVSTTKGLGTYYISTLTPMVSGILSNQSTELTSTVGGLGQTYISTTSLTSTVSGLSTIYILSSNLTSTVAGFSIPLTSNLVSTVSGLGSLSNGNAYISSTQLVSTVSNVTTSNTAFLTQVVADLASPPYGYISSTQLTSTVTGLSNIYIISAHLISTVASFATTSSSNLVSTVNGLGSLSNGNAYISAPQLLSTVSNVTTSNTALLTQTVADLASLPYGYISTTQLISTVTGLSNIYIRSAQLISTVAGVGQVNTSNLVSTVNGLGSLLNGNAYISSTQLFSTVSNVTTSNTALLTQTVAHLASPPYSYISTTQLTSTVSGLSNIYIRSAQLISTVAGFGTLSGCNLASTVNGLGSLLNGNAYISSTQLFSTVSNVTVSNAGLFSQVIANLASQPYRYISTASLVSTVMRLSNIYIVRSNLTSTIAEVGTVNPIQSSNLVSTNVGLGSLRNGNAYISSTQLFSTVSNVLRSNETLFSQTMPHLANEPYTYISTASLTSTTNGLTGYITPAQVTSTITGLNIIYQSNVTTTVNNLGTTGPIVSTTQLFSTVLNVTNSNAVFFADRMKNLASLPYRYISSASLISTVAGIEGYALFERVEPVRVSLTSNLVSTVNGLGSLLNGNAYISSTQLFSTVSNVTFSNAAFFAQLIPNIGNLPYSYISSASLISTAQGLGSNYLSSATLVATVSNYTASTKYSDAQLTSSIANLGTKGYYSTASLTSTLAGLGGFSYISLLSLMSTATGLSNIYVFSNTVPATFTTITTNASNRVGSGLTSTVGGLGSLVTPAGYGYISTSAGYTGVPRYLGIPSYISCLYAVDTVILRSTTAGFATALGSPPSVTNQLIPIAVQSNSPLFIYTTSNTLTPSLNASIRFDGVQLSNVYCTCNVTSATFSATSYYADGTQLNSSSDKRLKFNVTPLSHALESLSFIEGISYRMIDDPDRECLGFLAQDIERVYPELIFTRDDIKSLKYDSIGVILLEAIKELNIQCDELLSTVSSLSSAKEV